MPKQKVFFNSAQGDALAAVLETPNGAPRATVLFAHCFTCTKDIFSARYLTEGLVANGCAVLRFDFTGLGESEGEFANTNFSSNVADLLAAAAYLREHHQPPALLVGHSLGGAAVLAAAGDIPEARAVATIGAPAEPAHVAHLFTDAHADIEQHGSAEVLLAGRPFRIKKQFLDDIQATRLHRRIATMDKALLIFHSVADATVSVDNARKIYEAAQHPKTFVSLDGADHLLSDKRDAVYVSNILAAWARRYLSLADVARSQTDNDDETVIVQSTGKHLAQTIRVGKHEMVADEPAALGGGNTGATPYGYLLSALGACTAITLRMYANRKQWALQSVQVKLSHAKVQPQDSQTSQTSRACETGDGNDATKPALVDQIHREIKIDGDLTADQIAHLLEIADKCPVHRTLHNTPRIITRLVNEE